MRARSMIPVPVPASSPRRSHGRLSKGASGRAAASLVASLSAVAALLAPPAAADVWVFEPSISLDQRFDDNYRLLPDAGEEAIATRLVGNLGLSRQARTFSVTGGARLDGLLTQGDYVGDARDSNQVLFLGARTGDERTKWDVDIRWKQDTPSRDISADLSDDESGATDSAVVTQTFDIARRELVLAPNVTYELSRRASIRAGFKFTRVGHEVPSAPEAIYTRYLGGYEAQRALLEDDDPGNDPPPDQRLPTAANGDALPFDQVSADTPGVSEFTVNGELDDFREAELDLAYRYSLSPISGVSATVRYSYFLADTTPAPPVNVPFDDLDRDGETIVFRKPRGRDSISTTTSFRLGYERELTPTIKGEIEAGVYVNTTDDTDRFRESDRPNYIPVIANFGTAEARNIDADEYFATLDSEQDGWLASVGLTRDAGLTRYAARFAVDVQPSSVGSQVETNELTGDVFRKLSPLLDASLRVRLYEPDRFGATGDNNRFARRFLSVEPRVVWRFTRAWTAGASYRYRRQKSRVDARPGESNALLFSLTYTPPSAVRDAANASGL